MGIRNSKQVGAAVKRVFILIAYSTKSFFRNNCLNMAAAISFYAIFSLLPLLFLLFSFVGFILGKSTWLFDQVLEFVVWSLPYLSSGILKDLQGLIAGRKIFGWFGMIVLIWSAEFVILAIQDALHHIMGVGKKTRFIKKRLMVWGVFFLGCIIALVSLGITAMAEILSKTRLDVPGIELLYYLTASLAFKYFLPFILMFVVVALVFIIMVDVNIKIRHAMLGSVIFSVLWEAAKHIFAWYISHFASFNMVYGSLGAIMILLLWIYYSAIIFLFSAEFIASVKGQIKDTDRIENSLPK
jgi:membrane protein